VIGDTLYGVTHAVDLALVEVASLVKEIVEL
jgi:hypothetical protein